MNHPSVRFRHCVFFIGGRIEDGPFAGGYWIEEGSRDPGDYEGRHRLSHNWKTTGNGVRINLRGGAFQ